MPWKSQTSEQGTLPSADPQLVAQEERKPLPTVPSVSCPSMLLHFYSYPSHPAHISGTPGQAAEAQGAQMGRPAEQGGFTSRSLSFLICTVGARRAHASEGRSEGPQVASVKAHECKARCSGKISFYFFHLGLLRPTIWEHFLRKKVPGNSQQRSLRDSGLMTLVTIKWPLGPLLQVANTRKGKS